MDNNERFMVICAETIAAARQRDTIGRLQEKTLHAALKKYFEPDETRHEIKIGNYYADAVSAENGGIIEIQTRAFHRLRNKLTYFLKEHEVTVVYPIPHKKWITWLNPDTGEIAGKKRLSPKTGCFYQVFPELYKIKPFLTDPHIHLHILLVDVMEYKLLNGWSDDKKKGASRYELIPVGLASETEVRCAADYAQFLPEDLPENFTSKDFKKCMPPRSANLTQSVMNILHHVGIIERTGKTGRLYTYRIAPPAAASLRNK